jgi:hypothetical protein
MVSSCELNAKNSNELETEEVDSDLRCVQLCSIFGVFSCLLLCKATTDHAYGCGDHWNVPTPSALSASTTPLRAPQRPKFGAHGAHASY